MTQQMLCDRCGAVIRMSEDPYLLIRAVPWHTGKVIPKDFFDLCHECQSSFYHWMKTGKADNQQDNHNG